MNIKHFAGIFWRYLSVLIDLINAYSRLGKNPEFVDKCILFSASDGNRGHHGVDGYFSPIFAPIQSYCESYSFKSINLSYPLSHYHSREVSGGAILLNRQAISILFIELIEKVMLGKNIAAQRKKKRRVQLLKNMLSFLKPSLIFAFQATQELCTAAHELGISVVEPMHGMNLSPSDEIFKSTIYGLESNVLPDAYLAYDDRTLSTLRDLIGDRDISVFRMPHPWHVECQNPESIYFNGKLLSSLTSASNTVKILVSLQWGYAGERDSLSNIIPNGVMHPSIVEAIITNPHVLWLLRLHPVQLRTRGYKSHIEYVRLLSEKYQNVKWEEPTSLPLPAILSNIQGHITMTSGTAGEAAIFGVPSLLLCPTLRIGGALQGWFSELVEGEYAEYGVLDAKCISDWISKLSSTQSKLHRNEVSLSRREFELCMDSLIKKYQKN